MRLILTFLLLVIHMQIFAQRILSVSGMAGTTGFYTKNNFVTKGSCFQTNTIHSIMISYVSDQLFWGGIRTSFQRRSIVLDQRKLFDTKEKVQIDLFENRYSILTGVTFKNELITYMPFVALNVSTFFDGELLYKQGKHINYQANSTYGIGIDIYKSRRSLVTPSMEIGTAFIHLNEKHKRWSIISQVAIRYYPSNIFENENAISYSDLNGFPQTITPNVKLFDASVVIGVQYNKYLHSDY
jgi:hypothetical protein